MLDLGSSLEFWVRASEPGRQGKMVNSDSERDRARADEQGCRNKEQFHNPVSHLLPAANPTQGFGCQMRGKKQLCLGNIWGPKGSSVPPDDTLDITQYAAVTDSASHSPVPIGGQLPRPSRQATSTVRSTSYLLSQKMPLAAIPTLTKSFKSEATNRCSN